MEMNAGLKLFVFRTRVWVRGRHGNGLHQRYKNGSSVHPHSHLRSACRVRTCLRTSQVLKKATENAHIFLVLHPHPHSHPPTFLLRCRRRLLRCTLCRRSLTLIHTLPPTPSHVPQVLKKATEMRTLPPHHVDATRALDAYCLDEILPAGSGTTALDVGRLLAASESDAAMAKLKSGGAVSPE